MMARSNFRTAYGLTPNETRLLLWLLSGRSLSTIAAKLGMSRKSARSALISAFCKAVDRHQAEPGMRGSIGSTGRTGQAAPPRSDGEATELGKLQPTGWRAV
jgi:hypothetical protein